MKQLGLAVANFADADKYFPPSAVSNATTYWGAGSGYANLHGWGQFLLPYIEQTALANNYDWKQDWNAAANQSVVTMDLSVMLCPSAPWPRVDRGSGGANGAAPGTWAASPTDYTPLTRIAQGAIDAKNVTYKPDDINGIMVTNQKIRHKQITDGTSNTIVLGEDAGRPQRWRIGKYVADLPNTAAGWADRDNLIAPTGAKTDGSARNGPCPMNCTNDNELYSFHTGGVCVAFADGSVHFIFNTITLNTVAALITRAGGEVIPSLD